MKIHVLLNILTFTALWVTPVSGRNFESLSLEQWQFNSYHLKYEQNWTAKLATSDPAIADHSYTNPEGHVEINGYLAQGRAELSSPSIPLMPFTWYEIEIQYQTGGASDSCISLAGLYPDSSRDLMDQVILPSTSGSVHTHKAFLHTGALHSDYHFFLGNTGIGKTVYLHFRFRELTAYQTPEENLMIVDLLKLKPDPENLDLWRSHKKFTGLFGFKEPGYIHPLEASTRHISKADPGIIVFSPTATDTEETRMGFFRKKKFHKGIRKILSYAEQHHIPVLGICAGHQSIALYYGAFLARLKDDTSGEYLKEIGPTILNIIQEDPMFDQLPHKNQLKITEAHLVVVGYNFTIPENLATSADFGNQIFRYDHHDGLPWYTFQGHIEKDWEYACPEGSLVMHNLLSTWGFIQNRHTMQ